MIAQEQIDLWKKKVHTINEAELKKLIHFNDWERSFMSSVTDLVAENKPLTMQQSISLNKIYRRIG